MAPEQFEQAEHADARSDIYSLACSLYFALTGAVPFIGRGSLSVLQKKLNSEFTPPSALLPSLSKAIDRTICKALSAATRLRPRTCGEFVDMLTQGASPNLGVARKSGSGERAPLPPDLSDRRNAIRYPSLLSAFWSPSPGDAIQSLAAVQDISTTGLSMQLDHRVENGSAILVQMFDEQTCRSLQRTARVRWVSPGVSGQWRMGCSFERPLSREELNALLGDEVSTRVILRGNAETVLSGVHASGTARPS
jgi:serine/threonine protein kinase